MSSTTIPLLPAEILPLLRQANIVEYASRTGAGAPITVPVTPYNEVGAATLDVSTGLTYPAKADRARRDPRVALLFADAVGSGVDDAPVVLVQGHAAVRDADLQAATDRYVRSSTARFPAAYAGMPDALLRRMAWYFARIWVEVTPQRILWWPGGDLSAAPEVWEDSSGAPLPPSDPAPSPRPRPSAPHPEPRAWRPLAADVLANLGHRDLTVVDAEGCPLVLPGADARVDGDEIAVELPRGVAPLAASGPACLTVHDHDEDFSSQRNACFVGTFDAQSGRLSVERSLETMNVPRSKLRLARELLDWRRRFAPRLEAEAARRGQATPVVKPELVARPPRGR